MKKFLKSGLYVIFLVSRLINLGNFPLFEDEAAYIRFAMLAKENFLIHWSKSFSLGLGPVFPNLVAISMHLVDDPVIASRLTTALLSLLSFYSIGVIAETFFNSTASFIARVLYLLLPYTFLHDRLALLDAGALAWILFAISSTIRFSQGKLHYWLPLLVSLFFAVLTKPTGFLAFALCPLFAFSILWQKNFRHKLLPSLIIIVVIEMTAVMWILTTISPSLDVFVPVYDRVVETKSSVPLWFLRENAHKAKIWIVQYSSATFVTLALLGGIFTVLKKKWLVLPLGVWVGITFIISILVSKFWYPRYILPGIPILIILASYPLSLIWTRLKWIAMLFFLLLVLPFIYNDYLLAFNPQRASMPAEDRVLYFNLWTSGVFAKEAKIFFRERLKHENSVVVFTDTMKILPIGLTLPLSRENPNFKGEMLRQLTFPSGSLPREIEDAVSKNGKVYLVFARYPYPPAEWGLKKEVAYQVSQGVTALAIYSYSHAEN